MAALGFKPEQLGVSRQVLDDYYLLHIAFLDSGLRADLEKNYIAPISRRNRLDNSNIGGRLDGSRRTGSQAARCVALFCSGEDGSAGRVRDQKNNARPDSAKKRRKTEFVNQNSYRLNQQYYAQPG